MDSLELLAPVFSVRAGEAVYRLSRTIDRTFTDTPASGGGNVAPQTFTHEGNTWQCWQVIPFLGSGVGPPSVGDCRVQLRNRGLSRGQNILEDMPSRVVLTQSGWTNSPWEFTRPTASNKFTSPGSGNNARRAIDYEPVRSPGSTPAAEGVAMGDNFTIDLYFE